ncbi:class I mannose-6-phosphate isomerase [Planctopirus ephydatiae]|nr:class I mannose-6-phosphate isomerase [Planctopirus ephydatiae]
METEIETSQFLTVDDRLGRLIPLESSELTGSGETLSEVMGSIRPLAFEPELVPKVWGGYRLLEHAARRQKTSDYSSLVSGNEICRIGESWEISGVEGKSSRLKMVSQHPSENGQQEIWTLQQLWQKFGASLAGSSFVTQPSDEQPPEFPWLVKHLECNDWLSLQVHPAVIPGCDSGGLTGTTQLRLFNPESASKTETSKARVELPDEFPGKNGKFEFWLVVETAIDSEVIVGPVREDQREELAKQVEAGAREYELLEAGLLTRLPVEAGQWAILPPGSVHTARGVTILEVQTPVDVTYRIDDYGRRGSDGELRTLHPREAARAIRSGTGLPQVSHSLLWGSNSKSHVDQSTQHKQSSRLIRHITAPQDPFQIRFQKLGNDLQILNLEEMTVLCVIDGELELIWKHGTELLEPRDVRLLPVDLREVSLRSKGESVSILLLTSSSSFGGNSPSSVPR